MGNLVLIATIAGGVGLALVTARLGLAALVNAMPQKQPKIAP